MRSIFEHSGERQSESGQPLALEAENKTADGLIFALFDELQSDNFHNIDLAHTAYRCKKTTWFKQGISNNGFICTENGLVTRCYCAFAKRPKKSSVSPQIDHLQNDFYFLL